MPAALVQSLPELIALQCVTLSTAERELLATDGYEIAETFRDDSPECEQSMYFRQNDFPSLAANRLKKFNSAAVGGYHYPGFTGAYQGTNYNVPKQMGYEDNIFSSGSVLAARKERAWVVIHEAAHWFYGPDELYAEDVANRCTGGLDEG